ncbi:MAG: phosphoribosylanthranilate isomerase [Cyanobacteriota bacterium]|nr:phosphoribosylanthranilate isomerase [Cyanobacteriota bacterium]
MPAPLLKICGLRSDAQARAVAALGVDAVGVIGVDASPRFVHPSQRQTLFAAIQAVAPHCLGVLVVADPSDSQLDELDPRHGHQVIQLHGQESPKRCRELRQRLGCTVWKAVRLRQPSDLETAAAYSEVTDALLLDAWVPDQLGGTGHRIPMEWLAGWSPTQPWWLAGGITAARVREVLSVLRPMGLDASSGVERAPGDKNLELVKDLVETVKETAARQD